MFRGSLARRMTGAVIRWRGSHGAPALLLIHLSDIHFGHGAPSDRYDQKVVLARLRRDLDDARTEGAPQKPDAVFVTGDVAFSGGGKDPGRVRRTPRSGWSTWPPRSWLGPSEVFVIPGNHDVNRAKDRDRNTARLMSALRSGGDEVDTVLADAGDRDLLGKRMGAYLDFASAFAPACLVPGGKGQLFWVHRFDINGLKVRLAGLNTALLCADGDDRGKLRLGKQQLHEALGEPPAKGELVIVMTHHPLRVWLEDGDRRSAEALIKNDAHIHLSGHVHEAESTEARGGGARAGTVHVAAGAVHNERQPESWIPAGHGYNWGAVVDDGTRVPKLRIWPRMWADRTVDFRIDASNVPRGKQCAEHALPEKLLPEVVAGGHVQGQSPGTVEVFYFHAAEDEDLVKKLDTHLRLLQKRGAITTFTRRSIGLGAASKEAVDARVGTARIFLALASPSFLASDYFDGPEWQQALDRVARGEARMVPVYLRPFDRDDPLWKSNRVSEYKAFPDPYDRLGEWVVDRDLDTMFSTLAAKLRGITEEIAKA